MIARQLWAAIERDIPDIEDQFAAGRSKPLTLAPTPYPGRRVRAGPTPELIERFQRGPLDSGHCLTRHLKPRATGEEQRQVSVSSTSSPGTSTLIHRDRW